MVRASEKETEILLGNKQLLGIFFVVAILLGVAFYGGYVVGKGAARSAAGTTAATVPEESKPVAAPATGGETHSVPADAGNSAASTVDTATATDTPAASSAAQEPPLGSPRHTKKQPLSQPDTEPPSPANEANQPPGAFNTKAGQTFLQVTAVGRDEAIAIADVLQKKGFRAHAVPKPGSTRLYRVLVGPIRDTADLSSTRDSLRKTGFREVIVQRY